MLPSKIASCWTSAWKNFRENRERAFAEYFRRRKENADALADLAIGNFIEMRDKTASKTFRAKKKLDHALEAALPGIYLPLYTMVTFTASPIPRPHNVPACKIGLSMGV